ncbi:MAG: DNA-binding transcriptional regulator Fis [Halieaceae bacterium]|nr:DNA-binding transcriptional regulator Fis [Halieaceae bacterium]
MSHHQKSTSAPSASSPLLKDSVAQAIETFLDQLDGETCIDLYDMVLAQMEEPLLRAVMAHTDGNQSRAAAMLGLNRGTLRTKLRRHGLIASSD